MQRRRNQCAGMTRQWQLGTELTAEPGLGADSQAPLHGFAEIVSQRQTQPGAAVLSSDAGARLSERLEDFQLRVLGDTDAGVADLDAHAILVGRQAHIHPAEAGEFQRVGQQIADDLPHAGRIAQYQCRELRVDQAGQFDARRGILRQQVGGVFDQ
ncbi:hypothetical protein D3C81_1259770 [compost metagenome]